MKLLITSALLFLTISPLAQAHHDRSYYDGGKYNRGELKVRVLNSTPVYKYVTIRQPQRYCEPALVHKSRHQSHNKGAAIAGGVLGGVIGHAASNNKHKGLGTIIGAVIGSSLAHNIEHANNKHLRSYQVQPQNCVTSYKKARKVRVLDGYNVTYRTQGKIYRTFRQDRPAKYISIYY
jgi:uncharacterized protein YcfJ